jgi:hypothetical protein
LTAIRKAMEAWGTRVGYMGRVVYLASVARIPVVEANV